MVYVLVAVIAILLICGVVLLTSLMKASGQSRSSREDEIQENSMKELRKKKDQ